MYLAMVQSLLFQFVCSCSKCTPQNRAILLSISFVSFCLSYNACVFYMSRQSRNYPLLCRSVNIFVVSHLCQWTFCKNWEDLALYTLRSEMVLNCPILLESFCLGTKHPSAFFQLSGTTPFFHSYRISCHSPLRSFVHFLYNLWDTLLGPKVNLHCLLLLTSSCTFHDVSLRLKAT